MAGRLPPGSPEPAEIQAHLAGLRARLLGGRGAGTNRAEIDQRTRSRTRIGGQATPWHLAAVAHQTAIARGDTHAIALDIATTRDELAATVQVVRSRLYRSRITFRPGDIRSWIAAGWAGLRTSRAAGVTVGAGATLAIIAAGLLLVARRRVHKDGRAGRRRLPQMPAPLA